MSVNLRSAFLGLKASARAMLENPSGKGGSIVLCSSQLGLDGMQQSKAAAS